MLSKQEKIRYNRHLVLPGFGIEGQEKLKQSRALVIGAGGLGCPVLQYLTAAGVGEIGIVDFDTVDESNLQRQILYSTEDIGKSKVEVAAEKLQLQNPNVVFRVFKTKLTNQNALHLLKEFDVIIDGSDNFSTRYLVNDACVILDKPLIYGSIYKFQGQVSVFNLKGKDGINGPNYRCLFPDTSDLGSIPNCSEAGVIGVLPGIIGSLQAMEAIKVLTGIGEPLNGKILMFDALKMKSDLVEFGKKSNCCIDIPAATKDFLSTDYDLVCGIKSEVHNTKSIEALELKLLLEKKNNIQFLDVREKDELPIVAELVGYKIPLSIIESTDDLFSDDIMTVVYCKSGIRSNKAILLLEKKHKYKNLYNLKGGVNEWLNNFQKN